MKKMIVLCLALALTFAVVIPASAGGNDPGGGGKGGGNGAGTGTGSGIDQGQQGPRGTFAITGIIASIGTNIVTINVVRGGLSG